MLVGIIEWDLCKTQWFLIGNFKNYNNKDNFYSVSSSVSLQRLEIWKLKFRWQIFSPQYFECYCLSITIWEQKEHWLLYRESIWMSFLNTSTLECIILKLKDFWSREWDYLGNSAVWNLGVFLRIFFFSYLDAVSSIFVSNKSTILLITKM